MGQDSNTGQPDAEPMALTTGLHCLPVTQGLPRQTAARLVQIPAANPSGALHSAQAGKGAEQAMASRKELIYSLVGPVWRGSWKLEGSVPVWVG